MPRLSHHLSRFCVGCVVLAVVSASQLHSAVAQTAGPLTPTQELAKFRLADRNLQIELVTSEPYLMSPVDVAWDADGRMYAAEITDYPTGSPSGRVVTFEDTDNDGKYDQFTVFAEGLELPTSVLPYRDGVLIMTARDIIYLIDADGDGISEKREVILTGLSGGHPLLRPGSMQWGLDNWVYASHGGRGELSRPNDPKSKKVLVDARDFRFLPDGSRVEPLTGASAAGLAMDAYGTRFPSSLANPLQQVVLEERYFTRNPQRAPKLPVIDILELGASTRANGAVASQGDEQLRAARGVHYYRGDALPTRYLNHIFLAEPRLNLVHGRRIEPNGATYIARRSDDPQEFLTSLDPWFRPVSLETGPDGALYIVDFYRAAYEYPERGPNSTPGATELASGTEKGRLWRVRPVDRVGRQRPGTVVRAQLFQAKNDALVRLLGSDNGWWRETAQRLLIERNAQDMVPALRRIFTEQRNTKARLHALWTLDGLGALDEKTLITALRDVYPGLRGSALRLAEPYIAKSANLRAAVLATIVDSDPRVRLQLAATLGDSTGDDVTAVLARIAIENADDPWILQTVYGTLARDPAGFAAKLVEVEPQLISAPTVAQMQMLEQLGGLVGARNKPAELTRLLKLAAPKGSGPALRGQRALLLGLADGLARAGRSLGSIRGELASMGANAPHIDKLFAAARATADAPGADVGQRLAAIRLLADDNPTLAGPVLLALATTPQPAAVQTAAVRTLVSRSDPAQIEALIAAWTALSRAARDATVAALLESPPSHERLVDALESARISLAALDPGAIDSLKYLSDATLRDRVAKLNVAPAPVDRAALVDRYTKEVAALESPPAGAAQTTVSDARGAEIFAQHCMACHQISAHGRAFGPDLALSSSLPREELIGKILDPSRNLSPSQTASIVITKSGQLYYGAMARETPQSIVLRRADGSETPLSRNEIVEIHSTGRSLMPDGFEAILSAADVADLLAFLKQPKLELLPTAERDVIE